MKTVEERVKEFIKTYEQKTGFMHLDKYEELYIMLHSALKEQDKITRTTCAGAVLLMADAYGAYPDRASINEIANACMNVKAL